MKDEEYYLQAPEKQKFYRYLAWIMAVLALRTEQWHWFPLPKHKLFRLNRVICIIFNPLPSISQIIHVYLHYDVYDFTRLAAMFSVIPFAIMTTLKLSISHFKAYKQVMKSFMDSIHIYNYIHGDIDEDKRIFIKKALLFIEKTTRYTTVYIFGLLITCYASWNVFPVINNIKRNPSIFNITHRLEICLYMWLPFDYEFNFYGYLVQEAINLYVGTVGIFIIAMFDTVNLTMVYHLIGHIKIVKYDLTTGFEKAKTHEQTTKMLVDITKYYFFITKSFKEVEAGFGLNIAGVYAQNLIQLGLLLYQLSVSVKSTEVLLTFGLIIPILVGVMIMISGVLENVRIESDDIPAMVYELPWESMSVKNQKLVWSILFQVQPILEFKAAFNIKTGIQPAISIIKTAFSYYVMIKARM